MCHRFCSVIKLSKVDVFVPTHLFQMCFQIFRFSGCAYSIRFCVSLSVSSESPNSCRAWVTQLVMQAQFAVYKGDSGAFHVLYSSVDQMINQLEEMKQPSMSIDIKEVKVGGSIGPN